jgi:methionyl-tRNA synthetase
MSFRYVRHRPDTTRAPIVEALTKAGYIVDEDSKVDLCVRHPTWIANVFVKLECKTRNSKKLGFVPRKDQADQQDYCAAHGVPYTLDPESALKYLAVRGLRLISEITVI